MNENNSLTGEYQNNPNVNDAIENNFISYIFLITLHAEWIKNGEDKYDTPPS